MIFFGEGSLRNAVREYLIHYHEERNHQGLDNRLIVPLEKPPGMNKPIETTERLGGMLKSYRRAGLTMTLGCRKLIPNSDLRIPWIGFQRTSAK